MVNNFFPQCIAHRLAHRTFSFIGRKTGPRLSHSEAVCDFKNFFSVPSSRFFITLSRCGSRSFALGFSNSAYACSRPSTSASTCTPAHRSADATGQHKRLLRTFERVARPSPAPQDFIKAGANIEPNVRYFDGPHHHTLNLIDRIRIQRTGLEVTKVFKLLFACGRPRRPTIPS